MIQSKITDLFGFEQEPAEAAGDPIAIMQALTAAPCRSCRLGFDNPNNAGFIWKGNPEAHTAVVLDMPSQADLSARMPLSMGFGAQFAEWLKIAGVSHDDVFITHMVQCPAPMVSLKAGISQRVPAKEEVARCFPRTLDVLRAMANLEIVLAVGQTAWQALLGGDRKIKTYQNHWFGTDLLPGVAVYCLLHPRDFNQASSPVKRGRMKQGLLLFKNEYYGKVLNDSDATVIAPPKKILTVLKQNADARREMRKGLQIL